MGKLLLVFTPSSQLSLSSLRFLSKRSFTSIRKSFHSTKILKAVQKSSAITTFLKFLFENGFATRLFVLHVQKLNSVKRSLASYVLS